MTQWSSPDGGGTTPSQFRACLSNEQARRQLGLAISDADALRILSTDASVMQAYQAWTSGWRVPPAPPVGYSDRPQRSGGDHLYIRPSYSDANEEANQREDSLLDWGEFLRSEESRAFKWAWINLGIAVVGLLLTFESYARAEPGGTSVVFWGAVVFGGFGAIKNFVRVGKIRSNPQEIIRKAIERAAGQ